MHRDHFFSYTSMPRACPASCIMRRSAVSVRVTTHLRVGKVWRNLVDHAHQSGGGVHRDFRLGILLLLVCHARMHSSRRRRHHVLCAAPGQCEQGAGWGFGVLRKTCGTEHVLSLLRTCTGCLIRKSTGKRQGLKFDGNLRPFEPDDADDDVTHGVSLCSAVAN